MVWRARPLIVDVVVAGVVNRLGVSLLEALDGERYVLRLGLTESIPGDGVEPRLECRVLEVDAGS